MYFFISILTLIILIIYFLRSFCVTDFFFMFHPSTFDLLGIDLYIFSICGASDLMTRVTGLKS